MPAVSYLPLDQLKSALQIDPLAVSDADDAALTRVAMNASTLVDHKAERRFDLYSDTKTFALPDREVLDVIDLQSVDTISYFGLTWDSTQYQLLPVGHDEYRPSYTGIRRLLSGYPFSWAYAAPFAPYNPYTAIRITGIWGYAPAVPDDIVTLTEMLAVRLWMKRANKYQREAGNNAMGITRTPMGLWTPDLLDLIEPYTRKQWIMA